MKNTNLTHKKQVSVELFLTAILFTIGSLSSISTISIEDFTLLNVILSVLMFTVIFETVRIFSDYYSNHKGFKVRFLVDATILFLIREVLIVVTKGSETHTLNIDMIGWLCLGIVFFMVLRIVEAGFIERKILNRVVKEEKCVSKETN
jgi:uncharacterized membrane protein (DUF373 family)